MLISTQKMYFGDAMYDVIIQEPVFENDLIITDIISNRNFSGLSGRARKTSLKCNIWKEYSATHMDVWQSNLALTELQNYKYKHRRKLFTVSMYMS